MNNRWYDDVQIDNTEIISSRVRLARNIKCYPFITKMKNDAAQEVINATVSSIKNDRTFLNDCFQYVDFGNNSKLENMSYLEKHIVSPEFLNVNRPKGILLQDDEKISIMINEEDHIRIQAIFPGENLDNAWDMANKIDDLIEESLEYAFDKDYGYLTSCPTNTGTGLRASYMVHIPLLEMLDQLKNILPAISKFGLTIRGIYGEGTEPQGSIYQISNQITMGKSEQEIMGSLKSVTTQIIENESKLRENLTRERKIDIEDRIYRAVGILTHCRKLSTKEAMNLLSDIRLGYILGLDIKKPKLNLYNIMMNIQSGNLQMITGEQADESGRDTARADYVRTLFTE